MKRMALVGALVAVLALWAVPALAQDGSVLPTPSEDTGVLPSAPSPSEDTGVLPETDDDDEDVADDDEAVAAADDDLADTGFDLTTGLLAGAGLLAAGGVALVLARRRGADA